MRFDGQNFDMGKFRSSIGQMGFLSAKRFITVENIMSGSRNASQERALVELLDSGAYEDSVMVFLEESEIGMGKKGKGTRSHPLLARLTKEKIEEFPLLQGAELTKWVSSEIKKQGCSIADDARTELVALVGPDLWQMSSEIEKLAHYAGGKTITINMVRLLVRGKFDENIFHLTDALASRDTQESFRLLQEQLASGAHELYILTMLVRQFRILLQVRELINEEPNQYTIASRLKLHPFVAQKAARDAKKFSFSELKNIYRRLMEIDVRIKSSSDDPRLLFDLLITSVCQAR